MLRSFALPLLALSLTATAVTPGDAYAGDFEVTPAASLLLNTLDPLRKSDFYTTTWFVVGTNIGPDVSFDTLAYLGAGYYPLKGDDALGNDLRFELYAAPYFSDQSFDVAGSFWLWYTNNHLQFVGTVDVPFTDSIDQTGYSAMLFTNTGIFNPGVMLQNGMAGPGLCLYQFDSDGNALVEIDAGLMFAYDGGPATLMFAWSQFFGRLPTGDHPAYR